MLGAATFVSVQLYFIHERREMMALNERAELFILTVQTIQLRNYEFPKIKKKKMPTNNGSSQKEISLQNEHISKQTIAYFV